MNGSWRIAPLGASPVISSNNRDSGNQYQAPDLEPEFLFTDLGGSGHATYRNSRQSDFANRMKSLSVLPDDLSDSEDETERASRYRFQP